MKNSLSKKIILITIAAVMIALSAVTLVACADNLDGNYYYSQQGVIFKINVEGNYLKMAQGSSRNDQSYVRREGTFVREKDLLIVNKGQMGEFQVKIDGKNLVYRELFDCVFVKD